MTDETVPQAGLDTPAPDATAAPAAPAAPSPADARIPPDTQAEINKRIGRLTYNLREAERQANYWREQAQARPEPAPEKAKTLEDFDYDAGRYQAYLIEQTTARATEAAEKRLKEAGEREAANKRAATFSSREAKFAESAPDYFEVTRNPAVPITQEMADAAADAEDGPALLHHLAKNVELAASIAALSPRAQALEMGRLAARLTYEREKAEAERKKVSEAPPPPPKVEGSEPSQRVSTTSAESDKLSDQEWAKAERARVARKAKRA